MKDDHILDQRLPEESVQTSEVNGRVDHDATAPEALVPRSDSDGSDERYRTIIESIEEGYYEVDLKGNFVLVNDSLCRILGYGKSDLLKMNYRAVMDKPNAQRTFEAFNQVYKTGVAGKGANYRIVRPDGTTRSLEVSISLIRDGAGTVCGFRGITRDITDRERVEQALRRSEQRYRQLVQKANDIIYQTDPKGYFTLVNPVALRITGFSEQEIVGKHFSELIHADYRKQTEQFYKKQSNNKIPETYYEFPLVTRSGETVWVGQNTQIMEEDDETAGFQSIARDITDRKKAEDGLKRARDELEVRVEERTRELVEANDRLTREISERKKVEDALRESEERYRVLLRALPDAVVVYDPDGKATYVNDAFTETYGWSREELLGGIIDFVPPEEVQATRDAWERTFRGEKVLFETKRFNKAGDVLQIQLSTATLRSRDGALSKSIVIHRNVTGFKGAEEALRASEERHRKLYEESRRREELYRSLLNSSPDAVVIYDVEGRTQYVNPSFTRIFGWTMEEVQDKRIDFVPESEREATMEIIRNVVWEGRPCSDFETRRLTKDKAVLDITISASRYHDHDDNPAGILVILRDISARKKAQKELSEALETSRQLRAQAEAASEAKSDFVANMSHEIRTPMNAIVGLTDLALRTELTPKLRDYLTKIRGSSQSLLGVVNDILDFSKIEAGKLDLEYVDFGLNGVMNNLSHLLANAAAKKGIEFLISIDPDVPCFLIGDPLRLGQVLTNLANNAVKFTERGEILVRASLLGKSSQRTRIEFSVADTGIGISPELLPKLFESFTQADGSTTRKHGGSGLGLTISKRLVEMMGGEILVKSTPGQGSTFSVLLEFDRQAEEKEISHIPPTDLLGMRVLVVDDSPSARQILSEILKSFSFEVKAVESGDKAIEELVAAENDRPYELVIMDYKMPGMDGIETANKIDADARLAVRIPRIIMVTAFGREDVMFQARKAGLDGFLLKPVQQSMLFDTIMEVFGREAERVSPIPLTAPGQIETAEKIRGARVLLAEDNEINQQVATEILESAGAIVRIACNGHEAVQAVEESEFHAVLMDVQMPEMDGYEATRIIRTSYTADELPIIAMTAHAMKGDREKCLEAGMNDHVPKPVEIDQLLSTIAQWIKPVDRAPDFRPPPTLILDIERDEWFPRDLPGIDIQSGLERLGGKKRLFKKLLTEVGRDYANAAGEIRDALADGDIGLAGRLAHTIKGVSGNIAAEDLYAAATRLDAELQREDTPNLDALVDDFEAALNDVLESSRRIVYVSDAPVPAQDRLLEHVSDNEIQQVAPALVELAELLRKHNMNAEDMVDSMRQHLVSLGFRNQLQRVDDRLYELDYAGALEIVKEIASTLNVSLEG